MNVRLLTEIGADTSTVPEAEKRLLEFRSVKGMNGTQKLEAYWPRGCIRDLPPDVAHEFVIRGIAMPADDEARAALPSIPDEQVQKLTLQYQADEAGVVDPHDRELFLNGVILGYEQVQVGSGKRTAYRPGPNWDKYKQAQEKLGATVKPEI